MITRRQLLALLVTPIVSIDPEKLELRDVVKVIDYSIGLAPGVALVFNSPVILKNGGNLKLNGNFVAAVEDTLVLAFNGTHWLEVSRSVDA